MKMLGEETLAGGYGSILPANEQTGILSFSSLAHPISTHRGLSTPVYKQHSCLPAHSHIHSVNLLLYFPTPLWHASPLPQPSLYTSHSHLTSRTPAGALYLRLPISISSSRRTAALVSPSGKPALGSTQPAPCTDPGCPTTEPFTFKARRLFPG